MDRIFLRLAPRKRAGWAMEQKNMIHRARQNKFYCVQSKKLEHRVSA